MGNGYLRKLLVIGVTSVLRRPRSDEQSASQWLHDLLVRKPVLAELMHLTDE
jgi:transposase